MVQHCYIKVAGFMNEYFNTLDEARRWAREQKESNLQETRNFTAWAQYRALIGG